MASSDKSNNEESDSVEWMQAMDTLNLQKMDDFLGSNGDASIVGGVDLPDGIDDDSLIGMVPPPPAPSASSMDTGSKSIPAPMTPGSDEEVVLNESDFNNASEDESVGTATASMKRLDSVGENTASSNESVPKAGGKMGVKRKQQVAKAVKKYRNRRKEELEYLKKKVVTLQETLDSLKPSSGNSDNAAEAPHVLGKRTSGNSEEEEAWRQEAQIEWKKRRQSEEENAVLRRQVESQMNFAQTLQTLLTNTVEVKMFPNIHNREEAVGLRLGVTPEERRQQVEAVCRMDVENAQSRLNVAVLTTDQLAINGMPYLQTNVRAINGEQQLEIAKANIYVGYTADMVAKAVTKIFWAQVELPDVPAGGDAVLEELDSDMYDEDTVYSRFVCNMGTANVALPSMEKLVIRHRQMDYGTTPTIVWRTVINDPLNPARRNFPRIDESGCLIVEDGVFNGQRGAVVKMVIHIRPPVNTLNLPVGAIVESYMSGFLEYMDQIEQLLGFILLLSGM